MMGNLYGIKQGNNSVLQFAINIEKVLGSIRVSHPTTFLPENPKDIIGTDSFMD